MSFIGSIAGSVIGKVVSVLLYFFMYTFGLVMYVESGFIGMLLKINRQIIISPAVVTGFPIVLAVANLALLCGLIIIGVMTILGNTGYGYKNALWKLIVIALVINFGLVISNAILAFSDSVSGYFLSAVNVSGQGSMSQEDGFASSIAGSFQPQLLLQTKSGTVGDADTGGPGVLGAIVSPIAAAVMALFAMIAIIITLGMLVVILMVRYVKLGIRLILLPIAWAAWVFPYTQHHFSNWWKDFMKQVFTIPIILFFLWLSITISKQVFAGGFGINTAGSSAYGDSALVGIFSGILGATVQVWVLVSLNLAGLFAAQSLGATGAGAAMGMFKGTANKMGNFVKRNTYDRGKKRAQQGLDYTKRKAQQGVATVRVKTGEKIKLGPGGPSLAAWAKGKASSADDSLKGRFIKKTVGRFAAGQTEAEQQRKKLSDEKAAWDKVKDLKDMSQIEKEMMTATGKYAEALSIRATQLGGFKDNVPLTEQARAAALSADTKKEWKDAGLGKEYSTAVEYGLLTNAEMEAKGKGTPEYYALQKKLFAEEMNREASRNIQTSSLYADSDSLAKLKDGSIRQDFHLSRTLENILATDRQDEMMPAIMSKIKDANERKIVQQHYLDKLTEMASKATDPAEVTRLDEIEKRFKKQMGNSGWYAPGSEASSGGSSATPPAGGTSTK